MSGVIYRIVNLVNGKFYVGSTNDPKARFRVHRARLNRGTHHSPHLQAAWQKYGATAFVFEIVAHLDSNSDLLAAEQQWLTEHAGSALCYNTATHADAPWRGVATELHPQFGKPKSAETRAAISATLKETYASGDAPHPRTGRTHTEEAKAKISAAKLANPTRYWEGKQRDAQTRQKISAAQLGKPKGPGRRVSEEGRAKIRAAAEAGSYDHWTGRKHTEEAKAKLSRPVLATAPDGTVTQYASITALREALDLSPPTVNRALKSGQPLSRGPLKGWMFKYVDASGTQ